MQENNAIRVLIADDHAVVRDSIALALEDESDIQIISRVGNGYQVLDQVGRLKPDVVLMDVVMPQLNGLEATRHLISMDPSIKVICLTMLREQQTMQDMLDAGCQGFVLKHSPLSELASAIRCVHAGDKYIDPNVNSLPPSNDNQSNTGRIKKNSGLGTILSGRERQVLQRIAEGKTSQQVSDEMFISINTVTKHRQNIARKLGINSVSGLIRYAINEGISDI